MNTKKIRVLILVIVDIAIVIFSSIMPLALRFGIFTLSSSYLDTPISCLPADICITIFVLALFRLYNRVWSYIGIDEMISIFKASLVIEALYVGYSLIGYFCLYC